MASVIPRAFEEKFSLMLAMRDVPDVIRPRAYHLVVRHQQLAVHFATVEYQPGSGHAHEEISFRNECLGLCHGVSAVQLAKS